jgi:polysaccharide pyruvyl transferase WcaK-like protein/predicted PP-loop superfamily ATPase
MAEGAPQEIGAISCLPGELSFEARVGGLSERIWYRTESDLTPSAEAALATCLMPAMRAGGTLTMPEPVSPRLLRNQREYQAIQRAWSGDWDFGLPRLREVEVLAPARVPSPPAQRGRVAAFFSGGVDSWATLLDNPEVTDLIFVRGIDLLPAAPHQVELADEVEERLRAATAELGLPLHVVETNLRQLSDPLARWETYYGCALVAVALFMAPLFERVLIPGDTDFETQAAIGANRLVDQLWSTERLEIVDDGGRHSRIERVGLIAENPIVGRTLRVCWENRGGAYNCGHCRKCVLTLTELEALGARDRIATIPGELDLEALAALEFRAPVSLEPWQDAAEVARAGGNDALAEALDTAIAAGKAHHGLAPDYRRRRGAALSPSESGDARHEIAAIVREPGELSFDARIDGETKRIWFRADTPVTPPADAALAACLMPAMRAGGRLTMSAPLSPRLLRAQREYQAVQRAWSLGWEVGGAPLREVEVIAPRSERAPASPTGRVAAFFSGGIDSWATVLDNPEVTDLIFVRGIDLLPEAPHQVELADEVEERLRGAAAELGLPLHVVETNVREISDGRVPWEAYFAGPLAAISLFFEPLFDRVLMAGDTDYETQPPIGSSWTVNQLWSTESLEVVDDGGRFSREERLRRIADHPVVQRTLRVCWQNPGGAYNCGCCRKCMRTKLSLEARGLRQRFVTFPAEFDPTLLDGFELTQRIEMIVWEDALDTVRGAGRGDLEAPLQALLARGRRNLGLPADHSYRRRPAPVASPTSFFATAATAEAIAGGRALAVLVGSYDGSGNFGDIAQLDATLGLLEPLADELLVAPVLERAQLAKHRALAGQMLQAPTHALYFDPGEGHEDELVPVAIPADLGFAACLLYGGGYLNPRWGDRKLAMLRATESLLAAAGPVCRIATGLQVDPGWITALGAEDRRALAAFELLGSRDRGSGEALATLGSAARLLETGDDAIGVLANWDGGAAADGGGLQVNLHFAEHDWVTDDPAGMLAFYVEFLAELGRRAGKPVSALPLIAYLDGGIDERPGVERLSAACAPRGIEVAAPRTLRPADLSESTAALRRSSLTLSCSYHVALTSLMSAVPAVLIGDNAYYRQKAAGLLDSFALPAEFATDLSESPQVSAGRVAEIVLDQARGAALRAQLATSAAALRRRRGAAEAETLGRLGAAALARLGAQTPRGPGQAEATAARAQLATVLGSRSWRLGAPLRALANRLRAAGLRRRR